MFGHLHLHTEYSALDSIVRIERLPEICKKKKMEAVAMTDHGNINGALKFHDTCRKNGIKPIIGCELYLSENLKDMYEKPKEGNRRHITVLAKNEDGFRSIMKILNKANRYGFHKRPRIDLPTFLEDAENVVVLSGCANGLLSIDSRKEREKIIADFHKRFKDDFYLELMPLDLEEQNKVNKRALYYHETLGIRMVMTNDVHYEGKEDDETQEVALAISQKPLKKWDDPKRWRFNVKGLYIKTRKEMVTSFLELGMKKKYIKEMLSGVEEVINKCDVVINKISPVLPNPYPHLKTIEEEKEFFKKKVLDGLKKKGFSLKNKRVKEILDKEFEAILEGEGGSFVRYFLIVEDLISWARKNMLVGPGRGCFLPGTKIMNSTGIDVPIEKVKAGEYYLNKDGEEDKVIKKFTYEINEPTSFIQTHGEHILKCTQDHKVLVLSKDSVEGCKEYELPGNIESKLEWIPAKLIRRGDYIASPIPLKKDISNNYITPDNYRESDGLDLPETFEINESFLTLMALYLAKGFLKDNDRKKVVFYIDFLNRNNGYVDYEKEKIMKRLPKALKDVFGRDFKLEEKNNMTFCVGDTYKNISIPSDSLYNFFKIFGYHAKVKEIPEQIFKNMSYENVRTFMRDYLTFKCTKTILKNSHEKASASNYRLLEQISYLLNVIGIPYKQHIIPRIKDYIYHCVSIYCPENMKDYWNSLFCESEELQRVKNNKKGQKLYYLSDNYMYYRVMKNENRPYAGYVYDLQMKNDHSYIANKLVVHNSVGGSLIAYCLGITQVDPLRWGLIFERFISEGRIDLPDIDIDFQQNKRNLVMKYLEDKYGYDNVANVVTFTHLKGKQALRDVSKVFDVPSSEIDKAAETIQTRSSGDMRAQYSIEDSFNLFEEGKRFKNKYPRVVNHAVKIEGLVRQVSSHAAGIVVSDKNLYSGDQGVVITAGKKDKIISWDKKDLEHFGLCKIDALGLCELSVIDEVKNKVGLTNEYLESIIEGPLDDKRVFDLLSQGHTAGVFQFNTYSMKDFLIKMKVENFKDLYAVMALVRPGTLRTGLASEYVRRRKGEGEIKYFNKIYEEITKETYGIMLYQEQIMYILNKMAGIGWKTTDTIRKAISKSQGAEAIRKFKDQFVKGCIERKVLSKEEAEKMFSQIETFGSYCVSGDTELNLTDEYGKITVEQFYHYMYGTKKKTKKGKEYRQDGGINILAMSETGVIEPMKARHVWVSGFDKLLTIRLRNNKIIKITANHEVYTENGWIKAKDLKPRDKVCCRGEKVNNMLSNIKYALDFSEIVEISCNCDKPQIVYDIQMEPRDGLHPNFIGNGCVLSNSFNLSHCIEYSVLAYLTAFLKINYPVEFMAACLNNRESEVKKDEYISEIKRLGIKVEYPDVRYSTDKWEAVNGKLYMSLKEIDSVGPAACQNIIKVRGDIPFKDEEDFMNRITLKTEEKYLTKKGIEKTRIKKRVLVNKRVIEALKKANAFFNQNENTIDIVESCFKFKLNFDEDVAHRQYVEYINSFIKKEEEKIRDITFMSELKSKFKDKKFTTERYLVHGKVKDVRFSYKDFVESDSKIGVGMWENRAYFHMISETGFILVSFAKDFYYENKEYCENFLKGKYIIAKVSKIFDPRIGKIVYMAYDVWDINSIFDESKARKGFPITLKRKIKEKDRIHTDIIETDMRKCNFDKCAYKNRPLPMNVGKYNIMILTDSPTKYEEREGKHITGKAGEFFWKCLESKGLKREMFCITSVVKCNPSGKKLTNKTSVKACAKSWLNREIEIIKPSIIFALGSVAKEALGEEGNMKELAGTWKWDKVRKCFIVFGIHPASMIYDESLKDTLVENVKSFVKLIKKV